MSPTLLPCQRSLKCSNTSDGAQHWRLQFTGHGSIPGFAQLTVHLFDSSTGFMALGLPSIGEQLYATSNRGNTWTQVQLPSAPCVVVTFVDARQGWALVEDPTEPTSGQLFDLYATSDGGATWQRLPNPPRDAYYMAVRAPDEVLMGSLEPDLPTRTPPPTRARAGSGMTCLRLRVVAGIPPATELLSNYFPGMERSPPRASARRHQTLVSQCCSQPSIEGAPGITSCPRPATWHTRTLLTGGP